MQRITAEGASIDDRWAVQGDWPLEGQKQLARRVMDRMGIDPARCALGETEHPFTTNFSRDDVRITTHYYPENLLSSLYSVIHEGVHALYELNTAPRLAWTCLATGASMGMHESQSRLYENLIDEEKGVYNEDGSLNLNPNSLTVKSECYLEPAFAGAKPYDRFQFVRNGYFCVDAKDSKEDALVFNRIVSLKSSFKLPKQN